MAPYGGGKTLLECCVAFFASGAESTPINLISIIILAYMAQYGEIENTVYTRKGRIAFLSFLHDDLVRANTAYPELPFMSMEASRLVKYEYAENFASDEIKCLIKRIRERDGNLDNLNLEMEFSNEGQNGENYTLKKLSNDNDSDNNDEKEMKTKYPNYFKTMEDYRKYITNLSNGVITDEHIDALVEKIADVSIVSDTDNRTIIMQGLPSDLQAYLISTALDRFIDKTKNNI